MLIPDHFEPGFSLLATKRVLQEIRPESLSRHIVKTVGNLPAVNLMALSCCDGHQFMHVTRHTQTCYEEAKKTLGLEALEDDCFHWRSENGGPFVLSVPEIKTRLYRGEVDNVERSVLATIDEGMNLKKLNVVLLIGHCMCGKVHTLFSDPEEYSDSMARAKERIMEEFGLPSNQVISWLQVHRADGRVMYHVDYSSVKETRSVRRHSTSALLQHPAG